MTINNNMDPRDKIRTVCSFGYCEWALRLLSRSQRII